MQVQQSSTEPTLVRYCAVSSTQYSHKKPVTDIHWLPDYFEVSLKIHFSSFYCFPNILPQKS